ncbi:MAG: phosphoribosylglycinamide formyltransferase [Halieaceae bacterium]|nr:phosphoribosylglycinamide formyltransferase [Halieaceae bacterium]
MNLAVLISGGGSNLQAFIDAIARGELDANISLVLSNRAEAYGLQRARQANIDTRCIDHRAYDNRENFDRAMLDALRAYPLDLVLLAGFMRILSPLFVRAYLGRLMNIHPSLLPKYPGLHTHQRALEAADREAGASVHFVTEELDGGPVIVQARTPILETDNADTLAARVLEQEHRIYPLAVRWFCEGRLRLEGGSALLDGKPIRLSAG